MSELKPNIVPFGHIQMAMNMARENENLTLTPYHDTVSKLTIGYGRNLEDKGIKMEEAEAMLANDVIEAHRYLKKELAFYNSLSTPRKAVLMDMYHNLGFAGLLLFRKMLTALRVGDFDQAADQIKDSRYWDQVGRRARRNYCMMKFNRFFEISEAEQFFKNGSV
jgi:lysozyme